LRFGARLRNEGVNVGSHVLVFIPLSIELYIAMIGVWSIGAYAVFIDFSRGPKFVSDSIGRIKPALIVCDNITGFIRNIYSKLRRIKTTNINSFGKPSLRLFCNNSLLAAQYTQRVDILKVDASHPAILTFTSGTTGVPKIAVRTHGFLINQYNVLRSHIDFNENHIDLGTLPVFTLANLAANMTTLLPDKSYKSRINASELAKKMSREGVTRAICSPALMANLLKYSNLPDLKNAYLGGGPVYPGILEKIRKDVDLQIVYGSTEAEPISSVRWSDVDSEDKRKIAGGEGLLVGQVIPQVKCRIGEDKEILVSGETVLKSYLGGIGDNENKIRDGNIIWHRTGDAGYIDSNGRLWLLGRVSQAIYDANGYLYPFCVESLLDMHFGIRGAVLSKNGERIVVIEKGKANPHDVLESLKLQFVTSVVLVKRIPMDKRHGVKIDYDRLEKLVGN